MFCFRPCSIGMLVQFLLRLSARRPLRENLKKDEVGDNMNVVWFSLLIFLLFQVICIIFVLDFSKLRFCNVL